MNDQRGSDPIYRTNELRSRTRADRPVSSENGARPHYSDEPTSLPDTTGLDDTCVALDDTFGMRCPFASVFASPVPAALAATMLVAVPAIVRAAPSVAVSERAATTEPEPRSPIVRLRAAPAGALVVDVVGPGDWCHGLWTVAVQKRELHFGLSRDRSIAMAGTCAFRMMVRDVPAGTWVLRIGDAQVRARVR